MGLSIYLLGRIEPDKISILESDFYMAQLKLSKFGFKVFNPMKYLLNTTISRAEAEELNLNDLIKADAVYILREGIVDSKSTEYKVAKALNKTFITGIIEI